MSALTDLSLDRWLQKLGYADEPSSLHTSANAVDQTHPYAVEIEALLQINGAIRARAVFDVDGVPTVVFVGGDGIELSSTQLDVIRQKIWNQNLANIVLEISNEKIVARPARKLKDAAETILFSSARPDGAFSAQDVASANLPRRFPSWFDVNARVDRKLLDNLSICVREIGAKGYSKLPKTAVPQKLAELLMGQVLFVSYLEHRNIVGEMYRDHHDLKTLHDFVEQRSKRGVISLFDQLKNDFNGDFLNDDRHDPWSKLNNDGFSILGDFLNRTDMKTGQGDFWNYDFSFIPVELLSGLYESFLSENEKSLTGAFYTPRHLATLAIEQAFSTSENPLNETIFDGACGSGILLTTAYRRLIALSEAKYKKRLSFRERTKLLERTIFGSDINQMACRVTAFSLYLSLFEGLTPTDIVEAQKKDGVKLPTLTGSNLLHGPNADFFSPKHGFSEKKFSMIISNPPWGEAPGSTTTSADIWGKLAEVPVVRRQIAGVFSLRALDFLAPDGKICLILPIALFLGSTNAKFVRRVFQEFKPNRLINFGDLQNLLFPTGEHTCHLFVGSRRKEKTTSFSLNEKFDYCVPKADMSLAYGRLAMQSADRHILSTRSVVESPDILVTLMWGNEFDVSLLSRLTTFGTLGDFWSGPKKKRRWHARKGVHFVDRSREPVSAGALKEMPHIPVPALRAGVPVLNPDLLTKWPTKQETVAHIDEDILNVFDGPRVLYTDGFSREDHSLRTVFFDGKASFSTSIGVISGPKNDARLLRFVAAYLRSKLAQYFLMLSAWKMLCERNAVHLKDIAAFPFHEPKHAANPEKAESIIKKLSAKLEELAEVPELNQKASYEDLAPEFDKMIYDYFDVSILEQKLIEETVEVLMPSIRPRSYKSLNTSAQADASNADVRKYSETLANELNDWQRKTGGTGKFDIKAISSSAKSLGGYSVVNIQFNESKQEKPDVEYLTNDTMVLSLLHHLRTSGLDRVSPDSRLELMPDTFVWTKTALMIARSMIRRSWSIRQAIRDAEHIVSDVQRVHLAENKAILE